MHTGQEAHYLFENEDIIGSLFSSEAVEIGRTRNQPLGDCLPLKLVRKVVAICAPVALSSRLTAFLGQHHGDPSVHVSCGARRMS